MFAQMAAGVLGQQGAAVGVLITDSFDRADSVTTMGNTDTGETWVPNAGTWGISLNRAYPIPGGAQLTTVVESGVADCTIEVTLSTLVDSGVCFRSTDTNNHFVTNATTLFRKQSGGFTSLGTFSTGFSSGNVIAVVLSGTGIEVFRNGASVLSTTSTFNQTATKHGLRAGSGGSVRFNDFSITT